MDIRPIVQTLPSLWRFIQELSAGVQVGTVASAEDLIERSRAFYIPERMAEIERVIPGWARMASYAGGRTLWHVNEAMVALLRLAEYHEASERDQAALEWVIFLHDLAKEPDGGRDHRHAFRSVAAVGAILPRLGFPVSSAYQSEFHRWFELTDRATRFDTDLGYDVQDNDKLSLILGGIRRMFGEPTRSALAAICLHQSITVLADWPVPAPISSRQASAFIDDQTRRYLLVVMLADTGGWNLFDPPTLRAMYNEIRSVF
ncbi:MAG: hypothetical protein OEM97_10015 [Acidimicrobiia bacterium]|nr:hypothetical protein [Acidimicrobiia bacterium]